MSVKGVCGKIPHRLERAATGTHAEGTGPLGMVSRLTLESDNVATLTTQYSSNCALPGRCARPTKLALENGSVETLDNNNMQHRAL